MRFVRVTAAGAVAGAAALGTVAMTPLAAQAAGTAQVSILHAVPNTPVDVCANGKALLTKFQPGTLAGPLTLPAGTYNLKVTAAGSGCGAAAVIQANGVSVPAGANVTVVAHLSAGGSPELTPYVNNVSKIPAGQARVTVRHDAAAPAVDVRAGGKVIFAGLTNPNEKTAVVPAGTVSADVVLAGSSTVVIGPASLNLKEGTNTIVYAWGSAANKNLKLAVQTISGLHSAPSGVNAGEGGQAAQLGSTSSTGLLATAGAAAVGGLGAGALALVALRRRGALARVGR